MNTLVRRFLSRGLNFRKDNLTLLSSAIPSALRQVRWLPVCSVLTNLQSEKVPNDFEQGLSKVLSEVLSKPEKAISVSLTCNVRMWRDGSNRPTATVEIWSIGVFDSKRNEIYTPQFYKYLTSKLGIPADRIVLLFHDLLPEEAGHLIQARLNETKSK